MMKVDFELNVLIAQTRGFQPGNNFPIGEILCFQRGNLFFNVIENLYTNCNTRLTIRPNF